MLYYETYILTYKSCDTIFIIFINYNEISIYIFIFHIYIWKIKENTTEIIIKYKSKYYIIPNY